MGARCPPPFSADQRWPLTDLATRILDLLSSSRVPLAENEIGHRLGEPIAAVMISLYELEQGGQVVSKLRGPKQRRYYEAVDRA